MKKYYFAILTVCCFISCSRVEIENENCLLEKTVISARDEEEKTSYHGTGNITWKYGDNLSILDGTGNNEFVTYDMEESNCATFYGMVTKGWKKLIGIYPYNPENALFPDGNVSIEFPSTQQASKGGFSDGANVAIGETESVSSLSLKNAGSYIKLAFTSSKNVSAIYIIANSTAVSLSGKTIFSPATAELIPSVQGRNFVILLPKKDFIEPGTYYAVVAPASMEDGLSVAFRLEDGSFRLKRGTKSAAPSRNKIFDLGEINADGLEKLTSLSGIEEKILTFDFSTADKPFTEALPTSLTKGKKTYTTTDGGYEFTFLVNEREKGGNNRDSGWMWNSQQKVVSFQANYYTVENKIGAILDGITIPAIKGAVLKAVEIYSPANTFPMDLASKDYLRIFHDDDYDTKPADKYNSSENWIIGTHSFTLPESRVAEAYHIVSRRLNAFCYIQTLKLVYEIVVPEKITLQ